MRAIDTNVLVRLIAGDSPEQALIAQEFIATGAWVPLITLVEAMWVVESRYGIGASTQADWIEALLSSEQFVLQDSELVVAALGVFRRRPKLGFSDCVILETARKFQQLPLGTFDRELARQPGVELLE